MSGESLHDADLERELEALATVQRRLTDAGPPPETDAAVRKLAAGRPRARRWLIPAAVAATAVLAVSLVVRVSEPPREAQPPERAAAVPAAAPAPVIPETPAMPATTAAASTLAANAAAMQPAPEASPGTRPGAPAVTAREQASPEPPAIADRAAPPAAVSARALADQPTERHRSREQWLADIAALRAAGREEEADREQRAFDGAYPADTAPTPK